MAELPPQGEYLAKAHYQRPVANSVNLIRCDGAESVRRCTIKRWDYLTAVQASMQVAGDAVSFDPTTARP